MKKAIAVVAGLSAISVALAACGGDDGGGGEDGEVTQVRMSYDGDDYMNQMTWMVADEKYWPELGFTEPAEVTASPEYLAGLIGGDVWVAQGESDVIWAAIAEGSVPLTIIGVAKDAEAWWMGAREGVDPDNLEGLKISGGPIGDRNITVAKNILDGAAASTPTTMEFVPVQRRLRRAAAGAALPARSTSPSSSRATWPSSRRPAARCSTRSSARRPRRSGWSAATSSRRTARRCAATSRAASRRSSTPPRARPTPTTRTRSSS